MKFDEWSITAEMNDGLLAILINKVIHAGCFLKSNQMNSDFRMNLFDSAI